MVRDPLSLDEAISQLNSMLEMDRDAMTRLVEMRIPTRHLLDHATVIVYKPEGQTPMVGLLGIINGLFGIREDGWGPICAVFGERGEGITEFKRTPHRGSTS